MDVRAASGTYLLNIRKRKLPGPCRNCLDISRSRHAEQSNRQRCRCDPTVKSDTQRDGVRCYHTLANSHHTLANFYLHSNRHSCSDSDSFHHANSAPTAAFAAFVVYDLQGGLSIGSTLWLILADTVEVLIAALGVSYFFDGVPRLNSVQALVRYSFFAVILAPFAGAFVGAMALNGDYWINWRVSFFSEALAFLTLTPAILSWVNEARAQSQKTRAQYLEACAP